MVVSIIVFLSDTVIAGYAVGETGISAMNIMSPIVSFTIFISCLIATGVAYSYNSAIGKADKKHADGNGDNAFRRIVRISFYNNYSVQRFIF